MHPKKISYTSENENAEKFLIFSPEKAVLMFQGTEAPKKHFIFQETELFIYWKRYIQNPSILKTYNIPF